MATIKLIWSTKIPHGEQNRTAENSQTHHIWPYSTTVYRASVLWALQNTNTFSSNFLTTLVLPK